MPVAVHLPGTAFAPGAGTIAGNHRIFCMSMPRAGQFIFVEDFHVFILPRTCEKPPAVIIPDNGRMPVIALNEVGDVDPMRWKRVSTIKTGWVSGIM
jgi:hypothetical protein